MKLLQTENYAVERAVISDAVDFEGARVLVDTDEFCAVDMNGWTKCVAKNVADLRGLLKEYSLSGDVCLLGAPIDAPTVVGFDCEPCISYAYLSAMPPVVDLPRGVEIKRLAPTLAQTVLDAYHNPGGGYTVEHMADVMRKMGVFGAIADGKLAGFIGRHGDGNMGMLEVFPEFKRRGIGGALERFLINYIMTFGRKPICDVFADNGASIELQNKLGLTPSSYYTFWCEIE